MIKAYRSLTGSSIMAGAFLAGCASADFNKDRESNEIYAEANFRISAEAVEWTIKKLGQGIQTIPVHPDDKGFLSGDTITELEGMKDWGGSLRFGFKGSVGTKNLRLVGGLDGRVNPFSRSGYRLGLYDDRQQSSDIRPPSQGSFVFSDMTISQCSAIPFLGARVEYENVFLEVDAKFPYAGFNARAGHDRYGKYETIKRDSWTGFGRGFEAELGFRLEKNVTFSIYCSKESYSPSFLGEKGRMENQSVGARFEIAFW